MKMPMAKEEDETKDKINGKMSFFIADSLFSITFIITYNNIFVKYETSMI